MSRKKVAAAAYSIGIDTGKNVLHVIGLDETGAVVVREKVFRSRIAARLVNVPRCLIGIEAGMATHYMARELAALGHDVKQTGSLCQAVSTSSQERLSQRPRSRRSCATPLDTLRSD